jgi:hypothetical protein
MNLEAELEREHSRRQADGLAAWVGGNAGRFAKLCGLFQNGRPLIRQRAGWVVSVLSETQPLLIVPHVPELLALGGRAGEHEAVARSVFRTLENIPWPEELHGEIHDLALRKVSDRRTPAAVVASAITVLRRMTDHYPELRGEAVLLLQALREEAGAAVRSRLKREFGI